jgi:methionyl-tRNA formyltransferase
MAKIVFMGTPDFAVPSLETLITSQEVIGVVTQPDRPAGRGRKQQSPPIKIVAEAHGIPVYQPKSLRNDEAVLPLREWAPEMIVVAAFGQILRPHVLELPPKGCLNIHASLLPRWRGAAPIQHAILAGDDETGISLMQMDEGLDTGPVFVQEAISIAADETATKLHNRLAKLGAALLNKHLNDILAGRLLPSYQNDNLATYAPMIKKEAGAIDWHQPVGQVDRHIRAMTPWPSAFTTWSGKMLKILAAEPIKDTHLPSGLPGQVVLYEGAAVILAEKGGLRLKRIQLSGKRAMEADDFLHGQPDFLGVHLPS